MLLQEEHEWFFWCLSPRERPQASLREQRSEWTWGRQEAQTCEGSNESAFWSTSRRMVGGWSVQSYLIWLKTPSSGLETHRQRASRALPGHSCYSTVWRLPLRGSTFDLPQWVGRLARGFGIWTIECIRTTLSFLWMSCFSHQGLLTKRALFCHSLQGSIQQSP